MEGAFWWRGRFGVGDVCGASWYEHFSSAQGRVGELEAMSW